MNNRRTIADGSKLDAQLRLVRIKSKLSIILGDCAAVARLTCEAARLRAALDRISAEVLQPS
jgi:hypothetical protein